MRQNSDGEEYLTPLGCLLNGPWNLDAESADDGYNQEIFINDKEISSVGVRYTKIQKDLVFELYKDGKIRYWLKSENNQLPDTTRKNEIKLVVRHSPSEFDIKNFYSSGYWKANFNDSTIYIRFKNKNISDLNYKWTDLGNGNVTFQEINFFDSIYNGKKVTIKKVNSIYYTTMYPIY
jgi:hypothetical protein